jgi:thiol-disulfide isomerase/thioredoxin
MNNIFKVINSIDLNEILNDNKLKLTLIMFGNKKCVISRKIKQKFIELSKLYDNMIFIYVDTDKFKDTHNFLTDIVDTPHFSYFIDNQYVYSLSGGNFQELKKITNSLYQDILKKKEEARIYNQQLNKEQSPNNDSFNNHSSKDHSPNNHSQVHTREDHLQENHLQENHLQENHLQSDQKQSEQEQSEQEQNEYNKTYQKAYQLFLLKHTEKQQKIIALKKLENIKYFIKQQYDYIESQKNKTKNIESL